MVIVRDGKEIELTPAEMYDIYRECKKEYLIEDIKEQAEEMGIDLSNKNINDIADYAENDLGKNDGYYEAYWMSIEDTLEQFK